MGRTKFGTTDAAFQAFTHNLGLRVSQGPAVYYVEATVAADYWVLQQDFAAKLVKATDPLTKGESATFAKNEVRTLLRTETQRLANQI